MSSRVSVSSSSAAEWQPLEYISGDPSTVNPPAAQAATERAGDLDILLRVKDAARILSTGPGETATSTVADVAAPRVAVAASYSAPSTASADQPTESVRSLRAQFEAPPSVGSGGASNGRAAPASAAVQSVARQPASGAERSEGNRLSKQSFAAADNGGANSKIEDAILVRHIPVTETEKAMVVIRRATIVSGPDQIREREPTTALPVTDNERGHVLIVRPTIVLHAPTATPHVAAGACDTAAPSTTSPKSASRDVTSRLGSSHPTARLGPSAIASASSPPAAVAAALSPDDDAAISVVTPSQLKRGVAAAAFWPPPPPPTTPSENGSTEVDCVTPREDDDRLVTPSSLRRGAATAAFWQPPPSTRSPSEAKSTSDFYGVGSSPVVVPAAAAELAASPHAARGPTAISEAAAARPFAVAHLATADSLPAATGSSGVVKPSDTASATPSETSSVHFQSPMFFRVPQHGTTADAAAATNPWQSDTRESPRGAAVSRRWNDLAPVGSLPVTDCEKTDVVIRRPTIVLASSDPRVADFRSNETSELNTRLQVPERPDELKMSDSISINGLDQQALNKPYGRALFQIVHSPVKPPTEVVPRLGMTEFLISKRLLAVSECED